MRAASACAPATTNGAARNMAASTGDVRAAGLAAADVNGGDAIGLNRPAGHESQLRHRVRGHMFDGAHEGRAGVRRSTLPQSERADGVPRVGRALARIELSGTRVRQLALELLERARLVAARQMDEAHQPVQGHGAEPRAAYLSDLGLADLGREARRELTLGLAQRLPRHVDRGGEPVREREIRQERERLVRRTEALVTPADVRQTEAMPPVVGLQRDRTRRGRTRVEAVAGPIEHEPKRGPRLPGLRIEPARFARVRGGQRERRQRPARDRRASSRTA